MPSRILFLSSFLLDEGFDGLLIDLWNLNQELDIMNYWVDLMHVEGRILNEPILGTETQVKLLNKFVTQHTNLLIYRSSTDEDLHLEFDIHQLLGRSES